MKAFRFSLAMLLATVANAALWADDYAWWPLNDGQGDVAQNLVAGGTAGTIFDASTAGLGPNGSVWANDPERGTVLGLSGATGWVDAGDLPAMTLEQEFSWSFWAKQSAQQVINNDIIVGNRYGEDGADTSPAEWIKFTPRRFEFHMNGVATGDIAYDSFAGPPASGVDIPSDDEWYHHTIVKEGSQITYYRDGIAESSTAFSTGMASSDPLPFAMGGQDGQEHWRGYLSDVQLYSSALDSDGIASAMSGELAAGDLYARWLLNDGDEETAADSGPNGLDGNIFDWDFDGLANDGSVWFDDPDRGTVLGLGGNSAWVDAGELPYMTLENDFTWAFWARQDPDQPSPANDIILGNRYAVDGQDSSPPEWIKFTPDRFEFHMNGAGAGDLQYDAGDDGPWVNHIVVKEDDWIQYYRDGELTGEVFVLEEQLSVDPLPFVMGGQDGAEHWAGYLSDVRLFDHALTEDEIDDLAAPPSPLDGDYNGNGQLDAEDLDLQAVEIAGGQDPPAFDLTGDGLVNEDDRVFWLHDLKGTWVGDADLDGLFDSADFVAVFVEGKYETGETAGWVQGDWNADLVFDSGDFVAAFVDGGYEIGPFPGAVQAVPEPSAIVLSLLGLIALSGLRRR